MDLGWQDSTRALSVLAFAPTPPPQPAPSTVVGIAGSGGLFRFDAFDLYTHGWLTNPNVLILGDVGRGKSTLVKLLLVRSAIAASGSLLVLDPKGEYGAVARAVGASVMRPRADHGGIDPLAGSLDQRERARALGSVLEALCERPLDELERRAVSAVCVGPLAGLADAARRLAALDAEVFDARLASAGLERAARLALWLSRVVDGDLAGIWETRGGGSALAPRVVVDLSDVGAERWVRIAVAALLRMRLAQLGSGEVAGGLVVVDEAWTLASETSTRTLLVRALKLARAYGVSVVAVTHRLADVAGAMDLIGDVGTVVAFGQSSSAAQDLVTELHLDERVRELVAGLGRGVALWLLGGHSWLVRHVVREEEVALVDTDARMRAPAP
ncbi:AAA ATPase [Acidimicrobium ferrooxidans DSM 10331]|uniref:AAA ATPase n=1 Tax=Acidimicrobium ferrooxidans (strain DSM 10331 / JCM 15462 / NBRC 103882 / ICP) TaxID=525909 RepID=C7M276_ACIFD|nr:DUF87 domain-containing protein [Acidimicrobium ferrooxidans]ACU53174.1 AAA ATPase [Acidimicrobium ferrooxidans DSM 10331]